MAQHIDPQATEQRARELLEQRITTVRDLVAARQRVADLALELEAAQRADHSAYQAALRNGWTIEELKQLGLPEPTTKPRPRRPAKNTTT